MLDFMKNSTAKENAIAVLARENEMGYEIVNYWTGHTVHYPNDQIGCEHYAKMIRSLKESGLSVRTSKKFPARSEYFTILC
jgi:hypothetical protein